VVIFQLHAADVLDAAYILTLRGVVPNALFVNWIGDVYPDMMLNRAALALAKEMDLATVVNADALQTYANEGITGAYWQIGYEPDMLTAEPDEQTPHHDVLFLGSNSNEHRHHLGATLRALGGQGINVGLYGEWGASIRADGICYQDFKRQGQLYRAATLAVADQEFHDSDGFCSNRTFNLMVSGGALCLHRRFRGMEERLGFKDGVHYVGWDNIDELPALIAYWLDDRRKAKREKIARNAQALCQTMHSFDARVHELFFELLPSLVIKEAVG